MSNSDLKVRRFVNLMAFVALILTATALLVGKVLQWVGVSAVIVGTIAQLGSLIASIVLVFVAYFYVKTKRKTIWIVFYTIAATAVVLIQILGLFG